MEFNFYKLQTAANDFIVVNALQGIDMEEMSYETAARHACARKIGIGAAGIVFLVPGTEHELRCMAYTPSGSEMQLSHDALFCAAKYAFDFGLGRNKALVVETSSAPVNFEMIDSANIRAEMGVAADVSGESLTEQPNTDPNTTVFVDGRTVVSTVLHVGRLYAVVFDDRRGARTESARNREPIMVGRHSAVRVDARLYSREEMAARCRFRQGPADYTEASAAAAVSAILNDFCERTVMVNIRGCTSYVQWEEPSNRVLTTTSPQYTFTGTFYAEESDPQPDR